jgi:hypothetical protein
MPLVRDELERGAHAWHVCRHRKLGAHQTVIRAMWDIVNHLIDRSDVIGVELGRIYAHRMERHKIPQGIHCRQDGRELEMICSAPDALQFVTVKFLAGTDLQLLTREFAEQGFDWDNESSMAQQGLLTYG